MQHYNSAGTGFGARFSWRILLHRSRSADMVLGLLAGHPAPPAATGGRSRLQWDRSYPASTALARSSCRRGVLTTPGAQAKKFGVVLQSTGRASPMAYIP